MHNQDEKGDIPERKHSSRKYWWLLAVCLVIFVLYFFVIRPQSAANRKKAVPAVLPVPVTVAAVEKKDVGVYITGIGSVVPLNTVTVKTRIDGEVMKVLYHEGQIVKPGDLLVQIDPRPYEVQLTQAEGQLIKDKALLKNAQVDLERYRTLWAQNSIPEQQMVTQESLVKQYEGIVKTDQGIIDNAKLQLIYSRITAPIDGRVGLRLVDPGNIVHTADTTGMLVITQLQPITVVFPVSEDELPRVLKGLKSAKKPIVEAYNREQKDKLATGSLLAIDNQIDPNTGTLKLRASFPNKDNELFPNQFVNARLYTDYLHGALVVPAEAIQRGPKGTFVYVVGADSAVTMRPVGLGVTQERETVVRTGLVAGELVVIEGTERLHEGSKVETRGKPGGATAQKTAVQGAVRKQLRQ